MGKRKKEIIRVVLDTNVLISALLFTGESSRVFQLWQDRKIIPVISRETFAELRAVLQYPKFNLTDPEIFDIIESELLPYFNVMDLVQEIQNACRDPQDDKLFVPFLRG